MAKHYEIAETTGADMDSRFYVDGRRVSRAYLESLKARADRLECLSTRGRQMPGGRIRRANYSVAVIA
jgi:hypothetical protein